MPEAYPHILIIAGTGRKVGKTALACAILQQGILHHEVVAVKITPHHHPDPEGMVLLQQNEGWSLYQQVEVFGRDSSRMLAAGASTVYLVQSPTEKIPDAFGEILLRHDPGTLFLFESGGLHQFIAPGLLLMVTDTRVPPKARPGVLHADAWLDENTCFEAFASRVVAGKNGWTLCPLA